MNPRKMKIILFSIFFLYIVFSAKCQENVLKIKAGFTDVETVGIDTPEDLEKIKGMF